MTKSKTKIFLQKMGFCDTGEPEIVLRLLAEILELYYEKKELEERYVKKHERGYGRFLGQIKEKTNKIKNILSRYTQNSVYLSYLYWFTAAGLIEHGSSIYASWITPKGEEVYNAIQKHGNKLLF